MPPWPRRSRPRSVSPLDGAVARKTTTRRAESVATATTSSSRNAKRSARAGRLMSAATIPLSVAPASARTVRVGRPLAVPQIPAARSIRTAARASVDALNSSPVLRPAPVATPPARSPMHPASSTQTAAPSSVRPALAKTQGCASHPDHKSLRPVRASQRMHARLDARAQKPSRGSIHASHSDSCGCRPVTTGSASASSMSEAPSP